MHKRKSVKMRGRKTHGYGSKKKHRGAGSRGGRGKAGRFKHKKLMLMKKGLLSKKQRFVTLKQRGLKSSANAINLRELVKLSGGAKEIDAVKLGYEKVLGSGEIKSQLTVKARSFSKRAKEKIEEAKGKAMEI